MKDYPPGRIRKVICEKDWVKENLKGKPTALRLRFRAEDVALLLLRWRRIPIGLAAGIPAHERAVGVEDAQDFDRCASCVALGGAGHPEGVFVHVFGFEVLQALVDIEAAAAYAHVQYFELIGGEEGVHARDAVDVDA